MAILHWFKDEKRISILLTIASASLYAYSLTQANLEIGFYGFIHSLPASFFIAVSLLTIASAILWVSPQSHGKLLGLQLALFVLILHLTPLAIAGIGGAQTGAQALYSEVGLSDYIFRNGHFDPSPLELWRLNWPGAMIITSAIMLLIDNADTNFVMTLNVFIWIPLITSFIFIFLKSTLGKDKINYSIAGTWIFFLGSWVLYYLMPSVVGYFLFLALMSVLATYILENHERHGRIFYLSCILLLLLILPATHLMTALVAFMILAIVIILSRTKLLTLPQSVTASRIKLWHLALILVVIIGIWSIFATREFFLWRLPIFIEQMRSAFRLDVLWQLGVTDRMVGSESHHAVNTLKIYSAVLFCVIGLAGGILMLLKKKVTNNDMYVIITTIGILGMAFIIGVAYKWELIQRAYIFIVPAMAYFGVKLLKHKITTVILVVLMIAAVPLHYISQYGNATVDFVSPAETKGIYFFHDHTSEGFITGGLVHFPLGTMNNREKYYWVFVDQIKFEDNILKHPIGYPEYKDHFIYIRPNDQEVYDFLGAGGDEHINDTSKFLLGEVIQHVDSATNCNLVYSNPDISIYSGISTLYENEEE